jgi:transposase
MTNDTEQRRAFEVLLAAAKNLRQVKGRFHSEQAANQLWDAIDKAETALAQREQEAPSLCTAEEAAELLQGIEREEWFTTASVTLSLKELSLIINAALQRR